LEAKILKGMMRKHEARKKEVKLIFVKLSEENQLFKSGFWVKM